MNILDFDEDAIVLIPFSTNAQDGSAIGPSDGFELADFVIYQDTSNTGKETTDGLFVATNWAGITGLHMLLINTAVDTGNVSFAWQAGSVYTVCIRPDETVDGKTVVHWIGSFRLGYVASAVTVALTNAIANALATQDLTVRSLFDGRTLTLYKGAEVSVENGNQVDWDFTTLPNLTGGTARFHAIVPKGSVLIDVALEIINPGTPTQTLRFTISGEEADKLKPPEIYIGNILYKTAAAATYSVARTIPVASMRL